MMYAFASANSQKYVISLLLWEGSAKTAVLRAGTARKSLQKLSDIRQLNDNAVFLLNSELMQSRR